ncbi:MAG: signal peptide peptidase SppA [Pirellulaceae bacterium]
MSNTNALHNSPTSQSPPTSQSKWAILAILAISVVLLPGATANRVTAEEATTVADSDGVEIAAPAATEEDGEGATKKKLEAHVAQVIVKGSLPEGEGPAGLFGDIEVNLAEMLERLQRARSDDKITAVVLELRGVELGRGKLNELRHAIQLTRQSGKRVYANMELGTSSDYLVACACDKICMPESGTLLIPGIRAEVMFFKGLLDKLDIQADMLQVGDFKGAAEPYTRTSMSDAFRKQYDTLVDDLFDQMVDTIATDRQLNRDRVRELVDRGMLSARQAQEAGLIDVVGYHDEVRQALGTDLQADSVKLTRNYGKKNVDTDFSGMTGMIKLMELMTGGQTQSRKSRAPKVAIVYAVGAITSGSSGSSPLSGGQSMGSDTIVKALRTADDDETVKAIVLRVDSPGGSALASDLIWHEIRRINKPIVASMGDIAASGGYYISMGCDQIVAEPGTITGSIGVVGGKLAIGKTLRRLGIQTDVISRGANSGILSSDSPFTDSERAAWRTMMEDTYEQFTSKAAAGRSMDKSRLLELAGGRIWTGRQAVENGLVDKLGTLADAIDEAEKLGGIGSDDSYEPLILPEPQNFLDQLLGLDTASATSGTLGAALPELQRHLHDLRLLETLFAEPSVLILPCRITVR